MFGFLKDKLKGALGKFSKDVEKESEKVAVETPASSQEKTTSAFIGKKSTEKIIEKPLVSKSVEKTSEHIAKEPAHKTAHHELKHDSKHESKNTSSHETVKSAPEHSAPEKKGFFQKLFGKKEEPKTEHHGESKVEHNIEHHGESKVTPPVHKETVKEIIKESPRVSPQEKHTAPVTVTPVEKTVVKPVEKHVPPIVEKHVKTPFEKPVQTPSEKHIHSSVPPVVEKPVETTVKKHIETPTEKIVEKHVESSVEKKHVVEPLPEKSEEKKGFFTKITETFTKFHLSEEKFEELFWELEVVMLENNVAVEVIEKIKLDMKKELLSGKISRSGVEELILATLKKSVVELFDVDNRDLISEIHAKQKQEQPYIITIIGVNGSGKTTSIAKLTHLFQSKGLSVVLAASDTFRAAAIQQLEEHANRLNTKLIKHDYHSDPAAVAFDAIKYAQAKKIDVVIIDTAGRLHSNTNLMKELEKVVRVCKPDIKIFVGESITGNDCVEQAKEFDKIVGIDAIILAKADVDEKGGAAISVSYVTQKPILYLGTGQTYGDLKQFDSKVIIESLEL